MLAITAPAIAFANVVRTQFIIPKKKDRVFVVATVIGAVVNFLVNCICIPKYGAFGAVIGTIAAEYSVMIYQYIKMKNNMCIIMWNKIGAYMVSGIFMLVVVLLIKCITKNQILNLIIQIVSGIFIYIGCILLADKETVFSLLHYIKKRGN